MNMVGVGMGALGCLQTAKLLKHIPEDQLSINILALDPTPRNTLTASRIDFLGLTRARSNMDFTDVPQMKHVLILYPHRPLHSVMLAAPIVPKFNNGVCVYDVILGCPRSILVSDCKNNTNSCFLDDWMASEIVKNFLSSHGTILSTKSVDASFPKCTQELVAQLDVESFSDNVDTVRSTHSPGNSIDIVRCGGNAFLNKIHFIMKTRNYNNEWSSRPYMYSFASQIPTNTRFNMYLSSESAPASTSASSSSASTSASDDHVDVAMNTSPDQSSSFSLWSWIFPPPSPTSNNNDDDDDDEEEIKYV
jgi:hypothetical protein